MWSEIDIFEGLSADQIKTRLWLAADWFYFEPEDGKTTFSDSIRARKIGLTEYSIMLKKAYSLGVNHL